MSGHWSCGTSSESIGRLQRGGVGLILTGRLRRRHDVHRTCRQLTTVNNYLEWCNLKGRAASCHVFSPSRRSFTRNIQRLEDKKADCEWARRRSGCDAWSAAQVGMG